MAKGKTKERDLEQTLLFAFWRSTALWTPQLDFWPSAPRDDEILLFFVYWVTSATSDSATLWTVAHQAPRSVGSSRWEYWSGWPCLPPGDLPHPGIEPISSSSPVLAGRSFIISALGKPLCSSKPPCLLETLGKLHSALFHSFPQLSSSIPFPIPSSKSSSSMPVRHKSTLPPSISCNSTAFPDQHNRSPSLLISPQNRIFPPKNVVTVQVGWVLCLSIYFCPWYII